MSNAIYFSIILYKWIMFSNVSDFNCHLVNPLTGVSK